MTTVDCDVNGNYCGVGHNVNEALMANFQLIELITGTLNFFTCGYRLEIMNYLLPTEHFLNLRKYAEIVLVKCNILWYYLLANSETFFRDRSQRFFKTLMKINLIIKADETQPSRRLHTTV